MLFIIYLNYVLLAPETKRIEIIVGNLLRSELVGLLYVLLVYKKRNKNVVTELSRG